VSDPVSDSSTQGRIRVVIAEDQAMVLEALAVLLERDGDIEVVAQVRTGKEAVQAVLTHVADVLITDIEMPEMSGIEAAQALAGRSSAKVIVVTTFARPGYLHRAIAAGATGYLLKDSPARELADAVRRVYAGQRVINPQLAAESLGERDPLTDRERQVLRLADSGTSSKEIARRLGVSNGTVRNYLSDAMGKLGAANRVEAAHIARAKGWL
jgi:two-component system, NarL family, response regulator DesR